MTTTATATEKRRDQGPVTSPNGTPARRAQAQREGDSGSSAVENEICTQAGSPPLSREEQVEREIEESLTPEQLARYERRCAAREKKDKRRSELLSAAFAVLRGREAEARGEPLRGYVREEFFAGQKALERFLLKKLGLHKYDETNFYGFKKAGKIRGNAQARKPMLRVGGAA